MTSKKPLGRLEKVNLRDYWQSEAGAFTPWLAQEENIELLGKTIGLDLEVEAQEKNVGPFRADILCKDTLDGHWVLIENQLARTDHAHLGQLLTYAAGLNAVTIIWIAAKFTEEHRATLDWLNDITDERFNFFGLEVELWRIGESLAAPKFNMVSKPNDWTRSVAESSRRISEGTLSGTEELQLRYWSALRDYLAGRGSPVQFPKPLAQHWMVCSIGRSGFQLNPTISTRDNRLGVELWINDKNAKAFFFLLRKDKDAIEAGIGQPLDWQELPTKKGSRIVLFREDTDPTKESDWSSQHAWFAETLERFNKVFRSRVKALNAAAWHPKDAEETV